MKIIFVAAICAAIVYTFRDSALPIYEQLRTTSPLVVTLMCISACLYELVEGWITCYFARIYNPEFTYWQGVQSAFYCSFYRVATLGSGAGIAAIYFLNERGIEYSKGTGMYTIEYMIHKVSIALFALIFMFLNWEFMITNFARYKVALIGGFILTALITAMILLVCCSRQVHRLIRWIVKKINRNGKIERYVNYINEQIEIFEISSKELIDKKSRIVVSVLQNLLKLGFWYAIPFYALYGTTSLSLSQVLAVTSVAVMLAAVIPSPAGIGSTEFVLIVLLGELVGTGRAGSISLLYRFATFVLPFLIGAVFAIWNRKNRKKRGIYEALKGFAD